MDILSDSHHLSRLNVVDTGRRRRWTDEAKMTIVEESYAGSRQASATARRHRTLVPQLFAWARPGVKSGSAEIERHRLSRQSLCRMHRRNQDGLLAEGGWRLSARVADG